MSFLKGLNRQEPGPTAGEIRTVLSAIQRERSSLEALVARAESAAGELQAAQSGDSAAMAAVLGERVATLEQQLRAIDALSPTLERAMMRLTAFDESWASAEAKIAAIEERTSTATGIVGAMKDQSERLPEVQHQIGVLRALAEQTTQKLAALEQQRDLIDRTSGQVTHLFGMLPQLEAGFHRQDELLRLLRELEVRVAADETQRRVSHETESLSARQSGLGADEVALREALVGLRGDMERSVSLVDQERRGMESLAERIAEIRAEIREYESKLQVLSESSRHIVGLHGQTQHLYQQVSGLTTEFKLLGEKAERARLLQAEAARLEQLLAGLGLRVQKIEDARPIVETAMRDLSVLRGSEDAVRDALEEVGRAQQELARLRESQGDTEKWLARSDESTRSLKSQVNELLALEPLVERVRKDVDRVTTSLDLADTRVAQLDDLSQRVANMHALGYELNERTAALAARMDGAEQRFGHIAARADEADTVADRIAEVANWIGDADRRMSSLAEAFDGLGSKARIADELKERLRQLEDELSRREGGLERAMEQLGRAQELRRDGADSAERLEEVVRALTASLATAEERSRELERSSADLGERSIALSMVQDQLRQFEEHLSRWQVAEKEMTRATDAVLSRQEAVDTLQKEVRQVHAEAAQTLAAARSIGDARREVEETARIVLDTQTQLRQATGAVEALELRRQQVERAEQRLSRAEAMTLDLRASLETLHGQRAVLDQALEKAGSLSLHMKQAESVIEQLREERTLADRVRAAVVALRQEDE
jgi:DNA repair exonuclease SbcCD ATPase subunit